MLTCHHLALNYDYVIFRDLNFTVQKGSACVIRGRNGCGKTSLLRHLALLKPADEGYITWEGDDIYESGNYKNNLCYVGHKLALKPELTVKENLEIWTSLRQTEELLLPAVVFFELFPIIDTKIAELSAGWQKKIALARLLATNAKIWLLDEPETNLDVATLNKLCELIKYRVNQHAIVIIASHNMQLYNEYQTINLENFV